MNMFEQNIDAREGNVWALLDEFLNELEKRVKVVYNSPVTKETPRVLYLGRVNAEAWGAEITLYATPTGLDFITFTGIVRAEDGIILTTHSFTTAIMDDFVEATTDQLFSLVKASITEPVSVEDRLEELGRIGRDFIGEGFEMSMEVMDSLPHDGIPDFEGFDTTGLAEAMDEDISRRIFAVWENIHTEEDLNVVCQDLADKIVKARESSETGVIGTVHKDGVSYTLELVVSRGLLYLTGRKQHLNATTDVPFRDLGVFLVPEESELVSKLIRAILIVPYDYGKSGKGAACGDNLAFDLTIKPQAS